MGLAPCLAATVEVPRWLLILGLGIELVGCLSFALVVWIVVDGRRRARRHMPLGG